MAVYVNPENYVIMFKFYIQMKKLFLSIIIALITINFVLAVPAKPAPIRVIQPDSTELIIKLNGDEHYHFTTTEDGFLIKQNAQNFYEYAKMNQNGEISLTGIVAKKRELRTESEQNLITKISADKNIFELAKNISQKKWAAKPKSAESPQILNIGQRFPVILVNFSDKAFVTPDANTAFCNMLNQTGYSQNGAVGSARDYFAASSNGKFQPVFDVYGPYTLPQTLNYYGQDYNGEGNDKNAEQMIKDACTLAKNDIDFSLYDGNNDGKVDNVFVFYAGYSQAEGAPANTIWPHQWYITGTFHNNKSIYNYVVMSELRGTSGSTISGIGTTCHEFGHALGFPDLYNTNNSYDNNTPSFWDIMDAGCYNGPGGNGDVPALYSAYEMFFMGWHKPQLLNQAGNYSLVSQNTQKNSFLITQNKVDINDGSNPNPKEFILLENRQQQGFDKYLPGHGLLVWRIVYNKSAWDNNHVNTSSAKRVNIIHAYNGGEFYWAFPNTRNINSLDIKGIDNASWSQSLSNITEYNENITFNYNGNTNSAVTSYNFVNPQNVTEYSCTETSINKIKESDFDILHQKNSWKIYAENKKYYAEIYTINGILLKTFNFENEIDIDKKDFQNGIYLLKISDLQHNYTIFKINK
jgi:M6 family metalloprotease-like protein